MIALALFSERIQSEFGSLPIAQDDEITRKLAMLIDGECGPDGIDRLKGLPLGTRLPMARARAVAAALTWPRTGSRAGGWR